MERRLQGNIGEAKAALYYTEKGYEVFLPTVNAKHVDLIAIKDSEVIRVQVKTTSYMPNDCTFSVGLTTQGGNRSWSGTYKTVSKDFVDEVFVWCSDDSMWVIPAEFAHGKSSMYLGLFNERFQVSGSRRERPPSRRKGKNPSSKWNKEKIKVCPHDSCETLIMNKSKHCRVHANEARRGTSSVKYPDIEELVEMISKLGYKSVGLSIGVSDNAIRKYISRRGYNPKTLRKE